MKFSNPFDQFHSERYLFHNRKRLEHLDSLNIDLKDKSIFEVGAGIGDHTKYLINKGCSNILSTEGRNDNLEILKQRFFNDSRVQVRYLDLDNPTYFAEKFEIGYCYGLLYHLTNPEVSLEFIANHVKSILLLETCVSYNSEDKVIVHNEDKNSFSQSIYGVGCKPGREWLYNQLKKRFNHVYMPLSQPDHDEFPIDWTQKTNVDVLCRAVFIASNNLLVNDLLVERIVYKQFKNKFAFSNTLWDNLIGF